jgi:hypothetical protein
MGALSSCVCEHSEVEVMRQKLGRINQGPSIDHISHTRSKEIKFFDLSLEQSLIANIIYIFRAVEHAPKVR